MQAIAYCQFCSRQPQMKPARKASSRKAGERGEPGSPACNQSKFKPPPYAAARRIKKRYLVVFGYEAEICFMPSSACPGVQKAAEGIF